MASIFVPMKKLLFFAAILLFSATVFAQSQFEVSRDKNNNSKVLKGIITKNDLANDTAFAWFAQNQKDYTPNTGAVEGLKKHKDHINLVVFAGTWCGDSKTIVPKLFALLDVTSFPEDRVTMFGTDRAKTTLGNVTSALNIVSVPTIIVMKDGKEIGRVVEYGKYGLFDMELAEILKGIN